MKVTKSIFFTTSISFLFSLPASSEESSPTTPLFNGKDLTGWKTVGGTGQFKAEDGCIVGKAQNAQKNTFLRTVKNYTDFEFTYEFKFDHLEGNSGVMFRANQKPSPKNNGRVFGYQCEGDNTKRSWTAGLFDEARRGWLYPTKTKQGKSLADKFTKQGNSIFKWNDWNTITIRCEANHIQTWLNGEKRVDYIDTDPKNDTREGFFGLQVHSGKSCQVRWRNLNIKELKSNPAAKKAAPAKNKKAKQAEEIQNDPIPASEIPPSPILTPEQALKSIHLPDGFTIQNIAEENVHQPVALSFDADGRAWVVEMTQFMIDTKGSQENLPTGRIKVLEDTNGDGTLDKTTIFLDKLILPRACAVTSDGLLYAHNNQLFFIKRNGENGTTPKGEPLLIDKNYAPGGNAEHKANGLLLARDNWYYNAKSAYRYRRINGKWIKQKTSFRGQWGITQDNAGRLFHNTNSTFLIGDQMRPNLYQQNPNYTPKHKIAHKVGSNATYSIRINPGVNRAYRKDILNKDGTLKNCTAACGPVIYRGDNFPPEFQNVAFIPDPSANLIKATKVTRDATNKPKGEFIYKNKEFIASTDEWFRPVNSYTAPDGTLWIIDMSCGLLQHKAYITEYLRKQYESRGLHHPAKNNGRIYRISYNKNKIKSPPHLSKATIKELSSYLNHPNGTIRDTAQRLIVERITSDDTQLQQWSTLKAPTAPQHPLQQLHTLWIYEATGHTPAELILSSLTSTDSEVVNSALELAHLSDTDRVTPAILSYQPRSQTIHSTLFALAKIGTEKSHIRALALIDQFPKVKQTKPLYVSALGLNVIKTADYIAPNDKELATLLAEALTQSKHRTIIKAPPVPKDFAKNYQAGKKLYLGAAACSACHGLDGEGQENLLPPLAPSDWVNTDKEIMAKVILRGLTGTIHVNGEKYATGQFMPARPDLTDQQIADLMVYIKHMKGNQGGTITADQVKAIRQATEDQTDAYTEADLKPAKK